LADEINRAPAKVQSALLEAMQEKQVTIGDTTFKFCLVLAQNQLNKKNLPAPEAGSIVYVENGY
jgi:MoxR-like ATPase